MRNATPNDLLKLAHHDPLIKTFVDLWLQGIITLEACLLNIVTHQHQSIRNMIEQFTMHHRPFKVEMDGDRPVVIDLKTTK